MKGRKFAEEEGEKLTGVTAHIVFFAVLALVMITFGLYFAH